MVRGVQDGPDLRHRPTQDLLDPLAEGGRCHSAPLAAASHADEDLVPLHSDEVDVSPVGGDGRVDFVAQDSLDAIADVLRRGEIGECLGVHRRLGALEDGPDPLSRLAADRHPVGLVLCRRHRDQVVLDQHPGNAGNAQEFPRER